MLCAYSTDITQIISSSFDDTGLDGHWERRKAVLEAWPARDRQLSTRSRVHAARGPRSTPILSLDFSSFQMLFKFSHFKRRASMFLTFHPVESPSCIGSAVVSLTLCRLAVPLNVARLKTPSTWTPRLHVGKRDLRSDQPGMVRLLSAASIFSFRHHVVAAVYISSSTHFYRYHADR